MRRHHLASSLLVLLALVGANSAQANEAHKLLMDMSEGKRAHALSALLEKSGEKCPGAKRTFYQGSDKKGNAFWNVECAGGGGSWVIQINNDRNGSTRIVECAVMKALKGPACFTKFKN